MASLYGLRILVVEDDTDNLELLAFFLGSEGASIATASSLAEGLAQVRTFGFDVVLVDGRLPDGDGFTLPAALRAIGSEVPCIALTGQADERSRARAQEAGFARFMSKPFDPFALAAAVLGVVRGEAPARVEGETEEDALARLVAAGNVRALLAELNGRTAYRFTSVLRVDDDRLESVWTFDRQAPSADLFPETQLHQSYCGFALEDRAPYAMADSHLEPRAAEHPARDGVRTYCGVPLFRPDGAVYGTLCHYDVEPRPVDAAALENLERVARLVASGLPKLAA